MSTTIAQCEYSEYPVRAAPRSTCRRSIWALSSVSALAGGMKGARWRSLLSRPRPHLRWGWAALLCIRICAREGVDPSRLTPLCGTCLMGPESLLRASAPGRDSSSARICARTDWAHPRPLHLRRGWTRPIPTSHLRRDHHICARTHSAAPGPRASGIPPSVLVGFLPACKWDSSQRASGIPPSVLVGFLLVC